MDAVDVGPHAGVDVADQGAVVPAIPQGANGRGKVRRHLVAQIAGRHFRHTEVQARNCICGRHDVPTHASSTDLVESQNRSGKVVRLAERGRGGENEPQVLGRESACGNEDDGIERARRRSAVIRKGRRVGQKQHVEQSAFTNSGHVLIMGDVITCLPLAAGHTPSRGMSRRRRLDGKMHLAFGIYHGRLMLALFATGVRVASIIPSLGGTGVFNDRGSAANLTTNSSSSRSNSRPI
jgi:hypothetical protein